MNGAKNKSISKREKQSFHLVITCDETEIFDAFELIKNQLADKEKTFLSLIYIVADRNLHPLFERELSILERRFSDNLLIYLLNVDAVEYCFIQELIEAIINSNTLPIMKFSVFGNTEFVSYVSGILRFLDVKAFLINSKTI